MPIKGKVLVAQGGGPTAVINQSLVGVILEARKFSNVTAIYGAQNGVRGIINENFIDLTNEPVSNLEKIAVTPSSALYSTRDKPDEKYCQEIFKILKAHDIRYFFYIGGNDSADTVRLVNEQAKREDYEFQAIHVPKTVDNDLMENDHTPGFGSAARFVANAFIGIDLDNRALPGVYIGIVMGRNAGFLTASSALAKKYPDEGPHLIYLPERAFSMEKFLQDVKNVYEKYGRCVIAMSEGVRDQDGKIWATKLFSELEYDEHGNVKLSGGSLADFFAESVHKSLKIKRVRSDTFGYLQRSFYNCVSEVDSLEARDVARKAVQMAIHIGHSGSIVIRRVGDYYVEYQLTELEKVAAKTRTMPAEFINEEGNHVTSRFIDYITPLVGSINHIYARFESPAVPKIVATRL